MRHGASFDQVSEFERGRVVDCRDCGLPFREIGQRVGRNRICHRWRQEETSDEWGTGTIQWNAIVFSNESRFCLQLHDGRIRVGRHRGERLLNCSVMHHHTGPAPSIMAWGGIKVHCYPL
ncbi:transposable element Tcb1 transposase [Trichonephila clavipes]|uniref:Transposable element Tcb1 transposase n=1 Tax=Trichonephila clavipes TaxID=2585209 RepID=A0A8X7B9Z9_TRICX|nr:transposable element Tcb1 transposase [Trichonephila clavipes]